MNNRRVSAGLIAAAVSALFYALVVGGVGGVEHLGQQATSDAPWLVLILAGTQRGLFVALRSRQRQHAGMRAAA